MIYCLTGELIKKTTEQAVISCGGVGYLVQVPATVAASLPGVGAKATLYTYMNITENDVSLFGFESEEQRSCFEMLIGVSGVGPKVGIAILTHIAAQVCKDAGEGGIAAVTETAGSALALCTALPLLRAMLDTVAQLL